MAFFGFICGSNHPVTTLRRLDTKTPIYYIKESIEKKSFSVGGEKNNRKGGKRRRKGILGLEQREELRAKTDSIVVEERTGTDGDVKHLAGRRRGGASGRR
ncbi:hypothetical protein HN51_061658 [Arachis hypogaea]